MMEYINVNELKARRDAGELISIIDVREAYELDICKIDAIHIPMGEIADRITDLPDDNLIVIMCKSGNRATAVRNLLVQDFGKKNIQVLEGGILAWIEHIDNKLEVY